MKKVLVSFLSFFAPGIFFVKFALADSITISSSVPGFAPTSVASGGPGAFIVNFYQFALIIAGILAFGAIVFGGVMYASAAGNPTGQSEGKKWIEGALYGLLLLAGAYIILYTINPNLVNLSLANLSNVNVSGVSGGGTSSCQGGCPNGGTCTNGTCLAPGGTVFCSSTTPGQCPVAGQTCVSSGGFPATYSCVSSTPTGSICGQPSTNFGNCPPNQSCVNHVTLSGAPNYACQ